MGSFLRRHRRIVPYLLLAPGLLWLILFYLLPAFQMLLTSFWSGTLETGYEFSLSNITNYTEALTKYSEQFGRSILYGGLATLLTFAISYPLAYTIAFRGGRFKNLLLFLVVAPFFTSFLLRTISWKIILGDTGIVLGPLKAAGLLPDEFRLLATPIAVIFGIAYNFLPFMVREGVVQMLTDHPLDGGIGLGHEAAIGLRRDLQVAPEVRPGDSVGLVARRLRDLQPAAQLGIGPQPQGRRPVAAVRLARRRWFGHPRILAPSGS